MENLVNKLKDFYKDKKVLVTGHTGFKGSWLCETLLMMGAKVTGYALMPNTDPSFFEMLNLADRMDSHIGDIADYDSLYQLFSRKNPEIVFHLAAQPIVLESYKEPAYTYMTNVMGTVNILECIRNTESVRSFINVTTDKVYYNDDSFHAFTEDEKLSGFDPYSNSKSCSELVTYSYYNSFLKERDIAVSTMRAGNVIGGGDFAEYRLLPDCIRAVEKNEPVIIRNPDSTRPFQHVLEPISAYIKAAMMQYSDPSLSGSYNIGPDKSEVKTAEEIVKIFCKYMPCASYKISTDKNAAHEASKLMLCCDKIKKTFGIEPHWTTDTAVLKTVELAECYGDCAKLREAADMQIKEYYGG